MSDKPTVNQEDSKILREALASVYKSAPPVIKQRIHDSLSQFAVSVGAYCQCPERVFVEKENKFACLDCGRRHRKVKGPIETGLLHD